MLKRLADTANGQISGKKIKFETFVQMRYLDSILKRANVRLRIMTNGQYELKRREIASNNVSQTGLDLDVLDHYNGTLRDVSSLSGGESFKASLSLALGLSDEIQSSSGGVELESMFIDEGFGSLDEESLNQAFKALSDLSQGAHLVGVISHVKELKDRIEKQIFINKDQNNGSTINIVV